MMKTLIPVATPRKIADQIRSRQPARRPPPRMKTDPTLMGREHTRSDRQFQEPIPTMSWGSGLGIEIFLSSAAKQRGGPSGSVEGWDRTARKHYRPQRAADGRKSMFASDLPRPCLSWRGLPQN